VHRIDIYFGEERGWCRDCRGKEEVLSLSELTQMACSNVPSNIGFHVGPPESKGDKCLCSADHLVADIVVSRTNDLDSSVGGCNNLVRTMLIFAPEFSRI
jgi:hypothetical protein